MKPDDLTRLPGAELVYEGCIAGADTLTKTPLLPFGARAL